MLRTPTTNISKTYWIVANTSAIIISYIGAALSVLWIIMVKGSKAWFEIYEAAIAAYEENNKYINKVKGNNKINPRWSLFAFQNQLGYRLGDIVHLDTIDIASYCWSILCRSMLGHRAYIDFSCLLCVTICCTNFLCKKQNPL